MAAFDDHALAELGHLNNIEFSRTLTRAAGRRGSIGEVDGLCLFAAAGDFPVLFNGMWRLDESVPGAEAIEAADRWFAERNRGYTICVRDGDVDDDLRRAAESAGLVEVLVTPEMICRQRVADLPLPDGVELRWVDDQSGLDDFVAVNDAAYQSLGMPEGIVAGGGFEIGPFTAPNLHSVVAYLDDRPVAAAQTLLSHGIAGIYWVGALAEIRGRGLGDAVARAVTNRAFDEGARANSLQASPMGEKIYQRMGYETLFRYTGLARFGPPLR